MNLKIYAPKKDIRGEGPEGHLILRGELFIVNEYTELPMKNDSKDLVEYWQEMKIMSNFGNPVFVPV